MNHLKIIIFVAALLMCVLTVFPLNSGRCPPKNRVYNDKPTCHSDADCQKYGKICCPNQFNTLSCTDRAPWYNGKTQKKEDNCLEVSNLQRGDDMKSGTNINIAETSEEPKTYMETNAKEFKILEVGSDTRNMSTQNIKKFYKVEKGNKKGVMMFNISEHSLQKPKKYSENRKESKKNINALCGKSNAKNSGNTKNKKVSKIHIKNYKHAVILTQRAKNPLIEFKKSENIAERFTKIVSLENANEFFWNTDKNLKNSTMLIKTSKDTVDVFKISENVVEQTELNISPKNILIEEIPRPKKTNETLKESSGTSLSLSEKTMVVFKKSKRSVDNYAIIKSKEVFHNNKTLKKTYKAPKKMRELLQNTYAMKIKIRTQEYLEKSRNRSKKIKETVAKSKSPATVNHIKKSKVTRKKYKRLCSKDKFDISGHFTKLYEFPPLSQLTENPHKPRIVELQLSLHVLKSPSFKSFSLPRSPSVESLDSQGDSSFAPYSPPKSRRPRSPSPGRLSDRKLEGITWKKYTTAVGSSRKVNDKIPGDSHFRPPSPPRTVSPTNAPSRSPSPRSQSPESPIDKKGKGQITWKKYTTALGSPEKTNEISRKMLKDFSFRPHSPPWSPLSRSPSPGGPLSRSPSPGSHSDRTVRENTWKKYTTAVGLPEKVKEFAKKSEIHFKNTVETSESLLEVSFQLHSPPRVQSPKRPFSRSPSPKNPPTLKETSIKYTWKKFTTAVGTPELSYKISKSSQSKEPAVKKLRGRPYIPMWKKFIAVLGSPKTVREVPFKTSKETIQIIRKFEDPIKKINVLPKEPINPEVKTEIFLHEGYELPDTAKTLLENAKDTITKSKVNTAKAKNPDHEIGPSSDKLNKLLPPKGRPPTQHSTGTQGSRSPSFKPPPQSRTPSVKFERPHSGFSQTGGSPTKPRITYPTFKPYSPSRSAGTNPGGLPKPSKRLPWQPNIPPATFRGTPRGTFTPTAPGSKPFRYGSALDKVKFDYPKIYFKPDIKFKMPAIKPYRPSSFKTFGGSKFRIG